MSRKLALLLLLLIIGASSIPLYARLSDSIYLTVIDERGRPVYGYQVIVTAFLPNGTSIVYSGIYRDTIRLSISQLTSGWKLQNERTAKNGSILHSFPIEIEVIDLRTYATDIKYVEMPVDKTGPVTFTVPVSVREKSPEIATGVQPTGESCVIYSDLVYKKDEWRRINIANLTTSQHSVGTVDAAIKISTSGNWGVRVIWSFGARWNVSGLFSWYSSSQYTASAIANYNSRAYISMPLRLVYEVRREWNYCGLDRYKYQFYVNSVDFSGLSSTKGDNQYMADYSWINKGSFTGQGTYATDPSYSLWFLYDVVTTNSFSIPVPVSYISDLIAKNKIPPGLVPDLEIYNDKQSCTGTSILYKIWADRGYTVYIDYMQQSYYGHPITAVRVRG